MNEGGGHEWWTYVRMMIRVKFKMKKKKKMKKKTRSMASLNLWKGLTGWLLFIFSYLASGIWHLAPSISLP